MLLCLFWSRQCVCLFVCLFLVILHNSLSANCRDVVRWFIEILKKLHFASCLLFCFVLFEISFQSSFTLKSIKRRLQINHLRNPLKRTKSCEVKMLGQSDDNIFKETVSFNLLDFLLYESLPRPWNITNLNWNLNRHWMKS